LVFKAYKHYIIVRKLPKVNKKTGLK
jgi:hypothetical protein